VADAQDPGGVDVGTLHQEGDHGGEVGDGGGGGAEIVGVVAGTDVLPEAAARSPKAAAHHNGGRPAAPRKLDGRQVILERRHLGMLGRLAR